MLSYTKDRYGAPRWALLYGAYRGIEETAVNDLQATVQARLPYVIEARPAVTGWGTEENHVLVGTRRAHPLLAELVRRGALRPPPGPQGYSVGCLKNPLRPEGGRLLAVCGHDAAGVLHGVQALRDEWPAREQGWKAPRAALDELPEYAVWSAPAIAGRGIWSWGYVVYDYRRFLDRMARLRLNTLTLWNDAPPLNLRRILDYAHARGIRVILGFPWGWGFDKLGLVLTDPGHRRTIRADVLETYRTQYAGLGMDGIYFQTLTEHHSLDLGGQSVAAAACQLVNDIARELYRDEPDLYIQFGLHATSIRERYTELGALDPRVVICWEDAGVLPFSYEPVENWPDSPWPEVNSAAGTLAYAKRLATFRPGTEFAMVPKGWTCLDWGGEFEHHGPFILGERTPEYVQQRRARRQARYRYLDQAWLRLYPQAARFYREILEESRPPRMTVTGLVEDAVFEAGIPLSVALFAQTLWDPAQAPARILAAARAAEEPPAGG